jgi:hypothetical protein
MVALRMAYDDSSSGPNDESPASVVTRADPQRPALGLRALVQRRRWSAGCHFPSVGRLISSTFQALLEVSPRMALASRDMDG